MELKKKPERFEDKIYTAATSQVCCVFYDIMFFHNMVRYIGT